MNRKETQEKQQLHSTVDLERALKALNKAYSKLEKYENQSKEPIAIIGMGCRLPGGASTPEAFWELLQNGVDTITEVPPDRWPISKYYDSDPTTPGKIYTRYGAFVEQIQEFDASFFGISPKEAIHLDPQQRLLLEVTWEALEHSATNPQKLMETQTGVFIGISSNDYFQNILSQGIEKIDAYSGLGNGNSIASGRISYILGLKGPSLAVDTACSSSLISTHLACSSLRNRECNLALAGGVHLLMSPEITINYCKAKMLSADGRCKTFDATADGFGRGEGCGMIVLKRLSDALSDKDNILAVIRGSATNQDGNSSGLTVPNGSSQQALIRQALENGRVEPASVSYLEAHGTGTSLGDPIEVEAMGEVFEATHSQQKPLIIGSVKTNIGHLESAAGIAGLIKVVLQLQNRQIAPSLHFNQPNPYINWDQLPVQVSAKIQPWQVNNQSRIAGISSFSIGGTNAHIVLEEALSQVKSENVVERPIHILTLSAKTEKALADLVNAYQSYLENDNDLGDICYTANIGRAEFAHRLALITSEKKDLVEKLKQYKQGENFTGICSGRLTNKTTTKIAFMFTGQGSQYVDMGRQLYETQPTFQKILDQCNEILKEYLEVPLLEVIYPKDAQKSSSDLLDQTAYTQPALFAIEYALTKLWYSWGIKPSVVMGHSVGEYVAACVAGVFSLEDGLKLIAMRGKLMQQLPSGGEMVSVMASESQVTEAIGEYSSKVTIAAINGPESTVISGETEAVATICSKLEAMGVKTKQLQVSHAFHSPLMEPMLAEFETVAKEITYNKPTIPLISNVTGEKVGGEITNAEYWVTHVRQPVKFAQSMKTLESEGYETYLEIGPKPILLGMGRQCVKEGVGEWLPSLRPGVDEWQQMLDSLGKLYVKGAKVDWLGFDSDYARQKVVLPTYPFQRERYWIETSEKMGVIGSENGSSQILSLLEGSEIETLAQELERVGNLSPSEVKLLPKLLELLVKQHQQQLTGASIKDWLYSVEWKVKARFGRRLPKENLLTATEVEQRLDQMIAELVNTASIENNSFREISNIFQELSREYIVQALIDLGWEYKVDECFSTDTACQQLGIVPSYKKLFNQMLRIIAETGVLQSSAQQWQVLQGLGEVKPAQRNQALMTQYPDFLTELTLLNLCGTKLSEVLLGRQDPLELIFPEGDLTNATKLYQESTVAKVMNAIVQQVIIEANERLPKHQGIRLLEIGGGTGGTTSSVLPHLNPDSTEYVFTDIGTLFISKAQEKFRDRPFVRYQQLDIEVDPLNQGFEYEQQDIIIAANVLHATKDLRQTLQNVRKLLAPGGILVLWEVTAPQELLDLTFGLLEGWWRFQDYELRPDYPLLSREKWKQLLGEVGFTDVVSLPDIEGLPEVLSQQTVFVAEADRKSLKLTSSESQNWLVLADKEGIAKQVATKLHSEGDICTLVFAGEKYQQIAPTEFIINPENQDDFYQLITTITTKTPLFHGVVQCWTTDAGLKESISSQELENLSIFGCGTTLYLVQALVKAELSKLPRLWLVTSGAQPVPSNHPTISEITQSTLWGMGKVISLEHPELNCTRIDLDPDTAIEDRANALFSEIWSEDKEDQVAWRGDDRYVSRLVSSNHQQLVATTQKPLSFRSDASYVITGGLGGLGLLVARWMVDKGAKHLVLVTRREPDDTASQKLTELEMAGAEVVVEKADVSSLAAMTEVLNRIENSNQPLAGVIHSAGMLSDGVLQNQSWSSFEQVMAPKVKGGWNLHQLTQNQPLDFFVLFSSAASLLGSPGQGNHSAANAFLDGLAHYRSVQGLPGLSIHWGAVSQVGEAAERGADVRASKQGMGTISPEKVLECLELLMSGSDVEVGVVPIEWSQWQERVAQWPFLANWQERTTSITTDQTQDDTLLEKLKYSPQSDRKNILIAHIQNQAARVLGITDNQIDLQIPLNEIGLDSLMALELRNRILNDLQVDIPITSFMEGITITALSNQLNQQLTQSYQEPAIELDEQEQVEPNNIENSNWIEVEL
ncbi:type I polyketide synthase [Okeania sp. SIO1I7]|uniref:type I polyketide synthase n=1 Tax=Okeania sp. SIO1I7 TaxID=2607772 RepID=UPI0013FC36E2|nr:type I polyketide synthase [Okeania sp. SIO1I7]NET25423.1 SDR family NAD(P)-dependent oxidoreductase [Okeania sp. SIO1I7]